MWYPALVSHQSREVTQFRWLSQYCHPWRHQQLLPPDRVLFLYMSQSLAFSFYSCNWNSQCCVKIHNTLIVTIINDIEWKVNRCVSWQKYYCGGSMVLFNYLFWILTRSNSMPVELWTGNGVKHTLGSGQWCPPSKKMKQLTVQGFHGTHPMTWHVHPFSMQSDHNDL